MVWSSSVLSHFVSINYQVWSRGPPRKMKIFVSLGKFQGFRGYLQEPGASLGLAGKEFACNVGDLGLIPGLGRSPGEGRGYPLQCSGLENSMDCIVHGVTESWTLLSDFHFHFPEPETKANQILYCTKWFVQDGGAS